ncbi:MAG: glycosyltransferase family 39 protein, partial [Mycobacterium sp.]
MLRGRDRMAIVGVVAVAAILRLYGLGHDSLAHDEAWRANWAHHGSLNEARRLPPLQYLMSWTLQHTVGRSEFILRLPFAVAGVACVVLLYGLCRRFLGVGAGLLVAAVAACHPVLVEHSRTLKVFSLEALTCAALMWAGLEAYRSRRVRQLLVFLGVGLVGVGLTFTGSLVAAAWMPVLAWSSFRGGNGYGRLRWTWGMVAALLGLGAAGCYFWLAGCPWLQMLRVYIVQEQTDWPAAYTPAALAGWGLAATKGMLQYVLGVTDEWPPVSWCVGTAEVLAVGLSLGVLWRRCRPLCVVAVILAVEVVLAGALRFWPFGKTRTMTFLVPLVAIGVGCGLWRFVRTVGWSPATVLVLGLC